MIRVFTIITGSFEVEHDCERKNEGHGIFLSYVSRNNMRVNCQYNTLEKTDLHGHDGC